MKGRHRVVRMKSGSRPQAVRQQELAKDEYEDEADNFFCRYPIADDLDLIEPSPSLPTMGRSDQRRHIEGKNRRS